jgi:hypothetical protein
MKEITLEARDLLLCGPFSFKEGTFLFVAKNAESYFVYYATGKDTGLTVGPRITCTIEEYVNGYLNRIVDAMLPGATYAKAYFDGWLDLTIIDRVSLHIPIPKKLAEAMGSDTWTFKDKWRLI